jgi:DNA-directed RNA polymerase beta subunit
MNHPAASSNEMNQTLTYLAESIAKSKDGRTLVNLFDDYMQKLLKDISGIRIQRNQEHRNFTFSILRANFASHSKLHKHPRFYINNNETVFAILKLLVEVEFAGQKHQRSIEIDVPVPVGSQFAPMELMKKTDVKGYFIMNGVELVFKSFDDYASYYPICLEIKNTKTNKNELKMTIKGNKQRVDIFQDTENLLVKMRIKVFKAPLIMIIDSLLKSLRPESKLQDYLLNTSLDSDSFQEFMLNQMRFYSNHYHELNEKYKRDFAEFKIEEILLHYESDQVGKLNMLALAYRQFVSYLIKERSPEDRDHLKNKCVITVGFIISRIIQEGLTTLKGSSYTIAASPAKCLETIWSDLGLNDKTSVEGVFTSKRIRSRLIPLITMGKFPGYILNKATIDSEICGFIDQITSFNRIGRISQLHTVDSLLSHQKNSKTNIDVRLHDSNKYGYFTCVEMKDGQTSGLEKFMSIGCEFSVSPSRECVERLNNELDTLRDFVPCEADSSTTIVFYNGVIKGISHTGHTFFEKLKNSKLNGTFWSQTSISFDTTNNWIWIDDSPARLIRPVLKMGSTTTELPKMDDIKGLSFSDFVSGYPGLIEYIDSRESETSLISLNPFEDLPKKRRSDTRFTHAEIHPCVSIMSVLSSVIPFSDHNQSPRNIFETNQIRQALSSRNVNETVMSKTTSSLSYPEQRLISTVFEKAFHCDSQPIGLNVTVAIMCIGGQNMEDSAIVSKEFIERGGFAVTLYKTYQSKIDAQDMGQEDFGVLNTNVLGYSHMNADGLPKLDTILEENDVVISKYRIQKQGRKQINEKLCRYDRGKVCATMTKIVNEEKISKVVLSNFSGPKIGDKITSSHGQKNIVASIIPDSDIPCTEDGWRPDVIINPHCLPSRMSIGQILEMILGNVAAKTGTFIDGTPFENNNLKLDELCEKYSVSKEGTYTLHGVNGTYEGIFMGTCYYMRLKHMVDLKFQARGSSLYDQIVTGTSSNTVDPITRQPTQGRKKKGALKIGEMETWCFLAHGMMNTLTHDKFRDTYILRNPAHSAVVNKHSQYNLHFCQTCNVTAQPATVLCCLNCGETYHQSTELKKKTVEYAAVVTTKSKRNHTPGDTYEYSECPKCEYLLINSSLESVVCRLCKVKSFIPSALVHGLPKTLCIICKLPTERCACVHDGGKDSQEKRAIPEVLCQNYHCGVSMVKTLQKDKQILTFVENAQPISNEEILYCCPSNSEHAITKAPASFMLKVLENTLGGMGVEMYKC